MSHQQEMETFFDFTAYLTENDLMDPSCDPMAFSPGSDCGVQTPGFLFGAGMPNLHDSGNVSDLPSVIAYNPSYSSESRILDGPQSSIAAEPDSINAISIPEELLEDGAQIPPEHRAVMSSLSHNCVECFLSCSTTADLLRHAKEHQHQPYGCDCGSKFSRRDVLNRHFNSANNDAPKYPCSFCRLHRGTNAFKRFDHLTQHIRNYHHHDTDALEPRKLKRSFPVCSHSGCPEHRDASFHRLRSQLQNDTKPFASQSAYTKHMREEHNESAFPCTIAGCDRKGRRGYFREKDLIKHIRERHPDAPKYQAAKRSTRVICPDCLADLDPSSMNWHPYCCPTRR